MSYYSYYDLGTQKTGKKLANGEPEFVFGVDQISQIKLDRVKVKMSLQDMHLIFQIVTFANENVSQEYLKKLELIK